MEKVRRTRALRIAVLTGTLGLGLVTGCESTDTRMSWEEVQALELAATEGDIAEAVPAACTATVEARRPMVQAGDVLKLTLQERNYEHAQATLQARVHSDGTIALPLPGRITVAGLDLEGVERAVVEAHVPRYLKRLTVFAELLESEPVTVIVAGAAGQPALVELPRGACTVVHALARTSGFAALGGSRVRVQPHDPGAPQVAYDLSCAADIRRALTAPPLQTGDVVSVSPATSNVVYAVGLLNSPGPIPVPPGGRLTLVQTLASAGGLVDFLNPQEATLWRRLPDGRTVRARIELAAILAGQGPDIEMRAGDVLDIPHTAETRIRQWLAESIAIGPFGVTAVYDPMADRRATLLQDSDNSSVYRAIVLDAFMQGAVGLVGAGP